jgi:phosphoribosylamine--glycine ligase
VGPEEPLVRGLRDALERDKDLKGLIIVGPGKTGAQLEGSKDFSKKLMQKYGIPTAAYRTFTKEELSEGLAYVKAHTLPVVLKADGLAAGKGVVIAQTHEEASQTLTEMLAEAKFGEASARVVVEEFLEGIEVSVFILTDGYSYALLPEAKDYKRIGDGDTGPNTGGMGAVSPVPFAQGAFMEKVRQQIIAPTLHGLQSEGISYQGFIFFGLIMVKGEPFVIEYNARMGDPETQAVMCRLENDLVGLFEAMAQGKLGEIEVLHSPKTVTTVVAVSEGYPGAYAKGAAIDGLEVQPPAYLFHAGTKGEGNQILSAGGRVLAVSALADTPHEARAEAYKALSQVKFKGITFRNDIGLDLIQMASSIKK